MYSIPVGQHGIVADNRKYFLEFNSTSIFKCLECVPLPLGTRKFGLFPNACLKFLFLNSACYTSQLYQGDEASSLDSQYFTSYTAQ